jgi:hypothetical protein
MDGKEILACLIRGSANIDQMRKEINLVTGILRSFVYSVIPHAFRTERDFTKKTYETSLCRWKVFAHKEEFHFECDLRCSHGWQLEFSTLSHGLRNSDCIKKVYEGLPVLIEGLRKTFPNIEGCWQYILDASLAYESQGKR